MMTKCSERVSFHYFSFQCPNEACGNYRESGDIIGMRSYPMCAYHAMMNGYEINKEKMEQCKSQLIVDSCKQANKIKEALNQLVIDLVKGKMF